MGLSGLVFYSSLVSTSDPGVEEARLIFAELFRRNVIDDQLAKNFYTILLRYSDLKGAKELTKQWPQLSAVPELTESKVIRPSELGYFEISSDSKKASLKKFNYGSGSYVVMFADCHFAFDAMKKLSTSPEIRSFMKENGLVIAMNLDLDEMTSLKKQFPDFELHPIYKTGSWFKKGFDVTDSPSFSFYKDGLQKFTFNGAGSNLLKNFCQGLQQIQAFPWPTVCR